MIYPLSFLGQKTNKKLERYKSAKKRKNEIKKGKDILFFIIQIIELFLKICLFGEKIEIIYKNFKIKIK